MRRALILAVLVGLVGAVGSAHAQSTAGAQSLLITPGARADGMGRAYVAVQAGPTMVWWNPAGLSFTNIRAVELMHTKLVPGLVRGFRLALILEVVELEEIRATPKASIVGGLEGQHLLPGIPAEDIQITNVLLVTKAQLIPGPYGRAPRHVGPQ